MGLFTNACMCLHKSLPTPVEMEFASVVYNVVGRCIMYSHNSGCACNFHFPYCTSLLIGAVQFLAVS